MVKKLKIYFICGAGLGSSLACQMIAQDVLDKLGIDVDVDHDAISSAASLRTDIIVSAENFKTQFAHFDIDPKIPIVFLHNIVSASEIEKKLIPVIKKKQQV